MLVIDLSSPLGCLLPVLLVETKQQPRAVPAPNAETVPLTCFLKRPTPTNTCHVGLLSLPLQLSTTRFPSAWSSTWATLYPYEDLHRLPSMALRVLSYDLMIELVTRAAHGVKLNVGVFKSPSWSRPKQCAFLPVYRAFKLWQKLFHVVALLKVKSLSMPAKSLIQE